MKTYQGTRKHSQALMSEGGPLRTIQGPLWIVRSCTCTELDPTLQLARMLVFQNWHQPLSHLIPSASRLICPWMLLKMDHLDQSAWPTMMQTRGSVVYLDKENTQYTCTWKLRTKHKTSKQLLKLQNYFTRWQILMMCSPVMCMFAHKGWSSGAPEKLRARKKMFNFFH